MGAAIISHAAPIVGISRARGFGNARTALSVLNPLTLIDERLDPIYYSSAQAGRSASAAAAASASQARRDAALEERKAAYEQLRGEQEAARRSRALAADVGAAYANWAGNGLSVSGTGGTASSIFRTTVAEGIQDIATIRDSAANRAWTHAQNARNSIASAENMLADGKRKEEAAEWSGLSSSAAMAASVASSVFSFGAAAPSAMSVAGGIASGASAAGSAANAYAAYRSGLASKRAYEAEASAREREARTETVRAGIEQVSGENEAQRRSRLLANDVGAAYANWAGNGLSTSFGRTDSLASIIGTASREGAMDISTIRDNAAMGVWTNLQGASNSRASAANARRAGRRALSSSIFSASVDAGKSLFSLGQLGVSAYRNGWLAGNGKGNGNFIMDNGYDYSVPRYHVSTRMKA